MINDSTNRNIRDIGHTNGSIWSYSDGYVCTPSDKTTFKLGSAICKTTLFENKITISTEEKRKTNKGGKENGKNR